MQILKRPLTATTFTLLFALFLSPALNAQTPKTLPGAKVELYVVSLNDEDFAKYTLAYPNAADKGVPNQKVQFVDLAERDKLLENLIGLKSVNVLRTPNITVGSTRKANVSIGDYMYFTTGVEEVKKDDKITYAPKNEPFYEGLQATVCPNVSADRKFVSLKLDVKRTSFDPIVPLHPVTKFITPVFEGGSQGQPISYSFFIQKPNISTLENHSTLTLVDKSSAIMYFGKQVKYTLNNKPRSMVEEIPYISRLFKNNSHTSEMQHVIMIATTMVVEVPAVDEYIEDYRTAVAEGRLEDAKRLAIKAIETDPKCFAK